MVWSKIQAIGRKENVAPPNAVVKTFWPYVKKHPVLLGIVHRKHIVMQAADLLSPWYLRAFFNTLALQQPERCRSWSVSFDPLDNCEVSGSLDRVSYAEFRTKPSLFAVAYHG